MQYPLAFNGIVQFQLWGSEVTKVRLDGAIFYRARRIVEKLSVVQF